MNMSQFAIELVSRIKDLVGPEIAAIKELMAAKDLEITSLKEEISHVRKSIPSPVDLEPQQLQIKNLSEQIQILRGEMLTEESLATKVAAIVIPEPIAGKDGESISIDQVKEMVVKQVAEIVIPEPIAGKDGESVSLDQVKEMVVKQVAEIVIPEPIAGKDGESISIDQVKEMVVEQVAAIVIPEPIAGKDGESISIDQVKEMVVEQVAAIVIPEPIAIERVKEMVVEQVAAIVIPEPIEGREGPVGKDGRDAVDIEIQPSIDQSKQYPRGTYAIHEGGLWKSFQSTNKMHGWECVVSGVKGFAIDQTDDRNFSLSIEDSKGIKAVYDFSMPVLIYKGVWRQGKYEKGDSVTTAGSVWYANRTTQEKPGTGNDDWTLAVKKGLDLRGTK